MPFDVLVRNGRVLDGTGTPWRVLDLGVRRGRIAQVGRLNRSKASVVIDAAGKYVAPGFIDIHTHSDIGILAEPTCECAVRQGVTTHVIGNCGDSPAPISDVYRELAVRRFTYYAKEGEWAWSTYAEYLAFMERQGVGINVAGLVGHGSVRLATMGFEERPPRKAEQRQMRAYVDEAMRSGAFGMSTGLVYPPGCFAKTEEIVELCKVVAKYGGLYASHIRGERETIMKAIKEAIDIGRRSGARVQISHNCPKAGASGRTKESLGLVEKAREEGLEVTIDNDVHTDFGPKLGHALPQYLHELEKDKLADLLKDPKVRARVRKEMVEDRLPAPGYGGLYKHGLFNRIFILYAPGLKHLEGKSLAQIAKARKKDP